MKKLLLTLFTTLASLGILANNLLPVSAPTLADEPIELSRAAGRAQKATGHSYASIPVSQKQSTVSAMAASASAPVIGTTQEPVSVEAAPVTGSEIAAAPLATLALINQPGRTLVSDWLDVPTTVLNRVSTLTAPAFQPAEELPRAKPEQVVVAQESSTSDAKSHTTLVAAWIETPSVIFDQIRFIPVSETPVFATTFIGAPERRAALAEPVKQTVTPSAIFDAIRFLPVSESPVALIGTPEERVAFNEPTAPAKNPFPIFDSIKFLPVSESPRTFVGTPEQRVAFNEPAAPTKNPLAIIEAIKFLPVSASPITLIDIPEQRVAFSEPNAPAKNPLVILDTIRSIPVSESLITSIGMTEQRVAFNEPTAPTKNPLAIFDTVRFLPVSQSPITSIGITEQRVAFNEPTAPTKNPLAIFDAVKFLPVSETPRTFAGTPERRVAFNEPAAPTKNPLAILNAIRLLPVSESQTTFLGTPEQRVAIDEPAAPTMNPFAIVDAIRFLPVSASPTTFLGSPEQRIAFNDPVAPTKNPSAIFDAIRFLPVSESPITSIGSPEERVAFNEPVAPVVPATSVSTTIAATQNDNAVIGPVQSAKETPALISNQLSFSQSMLQPFETAPVPSAVLVADNSVTNEKGGPSAATREIQPNVNLSAKNSNGPAPVLINGNTEFSADLLKPMNSSQAAAKPFYVSTSSTQGGTNELTVAPNPDGGYCDPNFVGQPIRFSQTVELKLDDLLSQLHSRFGVNFIMGPMISQLPLNVKAGSIPWNVLLRSQLFLSGVRARCIDPNTIELVQNSVLPSLQDMADVKTKFIKLKFLQRTSSGSVDLAGRSQGSQGGSQGGCGGSGSNGGQSGGSSSGGGGGQGQQGETAGKQGSNKFDKLVQEIEKILGIRSMTQSSSGGGGGGQTGQQTEERRTNRSVTQIPGRNILVIKATEEEFALIDKVIALADRPPFQVVIKGLIYSANQDRLRDIGVQTTITGSAGPSNNPKGGIFGHTLGEGGTLFDFSAMIGTFDFNVQVNALQQNGVISVKSRPFSTVLDGLCTVLDVGRQLPIVINSTLGGQGDVTFVNASNNLSVTPYVVDDENGNPIAVTLELVLRANDVDSSVTTLGVPAISTREVQTQLLLGEDKTAILGGFTVDQDSKTLSKTPGLGDIPIIGELFKRRIRDTRINRLYFALSVSVIPFGEAITPVAVPGANTDPPSITPRMKKIADEQEPKQVVAPKKDTDH